MRTCMQMLCMLLLLLLTEDAVGSDLGAAAVGAVGLVRRDVHLVDVALLHQLQDFRPAVNRRATHTEQQQRRAKNARRW